MQFADFIMLRNRRSFVFFSGSMSITTQVAFSQVAVFDTATCEIYLSVLFNTYASLRSELPEFITVHVVVTTLLLVETGAGMPFRVFMTILLPPAASAGTITALLFLPLREVDSLEALTF